MATNQELPVFDHSAADFTKVGPRRVHMERYFRSLGLWNADQVKVLREMSEENACTTLRSKGYLKVGQLYFEYVVDYGVWYNILGYGKASFDDHPWPVPVSAMPSKKDFSEGVSRFYQDWQLRNKSLPESQGESSKVPKSEVSTKDAATPIPLAQPTAVAETSQKPPAVVKDAVAVKYDPTIPFALQARPNVATQNVRGSSAKPIVAKETARKPSVAPVAPKTVVAKQPVPAVPAARQASKPPADHSAGIAKVGAALADITLATAAEQSVKMEKQKEKVEAEVEMAGVIEARLAEKINEAHAIFDEESKDLSKQRSEILDEKIARAKALAEANECSPDDWHYFMEDDDDEPIIPISEVIPVRHDFGVNDVKWSGPMEPNPDSLQSIWEDLHFERYNVGPIIGPFEIALPEWMDFNDLVLSDDGVSFDSIETDGLIDDDVMITWSVNDRRPISLIVGPRPTQKHDLSDKHLWLRVRTVWTKVAEWVAGVYKGRPHRLTDFLRYRQAQELMGVPFLSLDVIVPILVSAWDNISEDPEDAALEARRQREDLDLWIPQIHAILSQKWEYASKIALAWVFRDEKKARYRLQAIEYAWAVFQPTQAYEWARTVDEKIYGRSD
ncbi:hypothetical protein FGADI_12500 [Fusarium gaditjirri]|uniref:Uncharacterized protein n=1 Tax=Fusarium gaditjirri TaxID=282569 RepID=A0A8H4SSD1_9HYPO|nr:hypothetical protein FGADI_12500 [Fusarium gaditjirri]